jgi:hypothetical protein
MRELLADLWRIGRFTPVAPYQRLAYGCGVLLILSGLVHVVVYLVDGGPWEGPVSWRKPIVFGLSFGITLMTLAWFTTFFRQRRALAWVLLVTLAFASLGEVFLISMQKWRGVASHFNETTTFNSTVFSWMGMLVAVIALVVVGLTVWSFARMDAPASLAIAIRLGLVLMLVSQAVGVQMIVEGDNTYGDEGALKVPHAFTIHAVQVLPALALLLLASDYAERRRVRILALGATGYAVLIASTMVQAYSGRSPLDPAVMSSLLALLGLGLLTVSAALALRGGVGRARAPVEAGRS